ncbi:MAG TPA: TIGR03118 family protein [Rhizomicrobium sp.]|nr:TIGR03118 family protein [Rhizomicrobium sp.]
MWHRNNMLRHSAICGALGTCLLLACGSTASAASFGVSNLVTNDQSVNTASITDPNLKNPWGLAESTGSPFWVGDNATGVSTLYAVSPTTNTVTKQGLTVTIPGDGTVTGVVFSGVAGSFNGDNFLFVSEDGTISGWRGALGTTAETLQIGSASNVYKGGALTTIGGNAYLYAANFRAGSIDVIKGNAGAPNLTGSFVDKNATPLPAGYAPFDIKLIGSDLFVTYALQDGAKHDDVAGPGNGYVDEFDLQGNFLGRIASRGTLDSPWGLALAPASFGNFAGDLLVGNFGDGTIDAFNLSTDAFVGALLDASGNPLSIDGLWSLSVGNGGNGGSTQDVYFTAGPNNEGDGLFGVIAIPEPMTLSMFGFGIAGVFTMRRRKNRAG